MDAVNVAEAEAAAQQQAQAQATPGAMEQGIGAGLLSFDADTAMRKGEKALKERESKIQDMYGVSLKEHDDFFKGLGVLGKETEERIRTDLDGIKGSKNKAKSMALLQAGLAILSADPSRGGFAAIGEGALKGLGAYKGDIKDLEERRDRMVDRLDKLDGLRRQEAIASQDGRQRIAQQRDQAILGLAKEQQELANELGIKMPFEVAKTNAQMLNQANNARIMADRTTGTDRLREELRRHEPGSPEYERILRRETDLSRAQGASREDVAAIRDPNYIKAVESLSRARMLRDANKDPKKAAEHDEKVRRAEADVATARNRAMSAGGGSTGGAASGTVDANNPLLRS
jgi:hypothetical protein